MPASVNSLILSCDKCTNFHVIDFSGGITLINEIAYEDELGTSISATVEYMAPENWTIDFKSGLDLCPRCSLIAELLAAGYMRTSLHFQTAFIGVPRIASRLEKINREEVSTPSGDNSHYVWFKI